VVARLIPQTGVVGAVAVETRIDVVVRHPATIVLHAGGQTRPRWPTQRRRTHRVLEPHPPLDEALDIGCPHRNVGVHSQPIRVVLVGEEEQHVGSLTVCHAHRPDTTSINIVVSLTRTAGRVPSSRDGHVRSGVVSSPSSPPSTIAPMETSSSLSPKPALRMRVRASSTFSSVSVRSSGSTSRTNRS